MDRPYIISWNLTYRCNLACEHCYLDAGGASKRKLNTENFADRSELSTEECFTVIDGIVEAAPECVLILTGGEPLLRRDILEIAGYASGKGLWVVVGTNGVRVSEIVVKALKERGVRGMALSLDSLDSSRHDTFRRVKGAWENTVEGAKILSAYDLPFIIQTTVGSHNLNELTRIAAFAHQELRAKVWNLYFLVPSGRGQFVSDLDKTQYDNVLAELSRIQSSYMGRMLVNAKCAPHYVRHLFEHAPDSPFLKTFSDGAGGCPAGTHYIGIRPNGDVTPCPYLPQFGGNLRTLSLKTIWNESELFAKIRKRSELGGRCGSCEFQGVCGGCRARAHSVAGDVLAEDPLCSYEPGKYDRETVQLRIRGKVEYGVVAERKITWSPEAEERMKQIPSFVRGMVTKAVESYCAKEGIEFVTPKDLDTIRSRMPANKIFSRPTGEEKASRG